MDASPQPAPRTLPGVAEEYAPLSVLLDLLMDETTDGRNPRRRYQVRTPHPAHPAWFVYDTLLGRSITNEELAEMSVQEVRQELQ